MIIAKQKDGKLVQIVKFMREVQFSSQQGWFLIVTDFDKPMRKQQGSKWVPADTYFDWVKIFTF